MMDQLMCHTALRFRLHFLWTLVATQACYMYVYGCMVCVRPFCFFGSRCSDDVVGNLVGCTCAYSYFTYMIAICVYDSFLCVFSS